MTVQWVLIMTITHIFVIPVAIEVIIGVASSAALIIGILIIVIVVLSMLVMRGRKPHHDPCQGSSSVFPTFEVSNN